jgi:hypothetical protein
MGMATPDPESPREASDHEIVGFMERAQGVKVLGTASGWEVYNARDNQRANGSSLRIAFARLIDMMPRRNRR